MGETTYKGNTEWRQITNPEWDTDSWGLDEATIQFSGRRDKVEAFENSLTDFKPMPEYGGMYLRGFHTRDHRSFPVIDARYFGLKSGSVPAVKAEDSISIQTVTTSGTTTDGKKISGEFSYRSARTAYSWIETSNPANSPKYSTVRRQLDPLANIISWRVTDEAGKSGQVPYSSFVSILNSLQKRVVVNDYAPEELCPGKLWGCRAVCDYVLIGT